MGQPRIVSPCLPGRTARRREGVGRNRRKAIRREPAADPGKIDYALEAKGYAPTTCSRRARRQQARFPSPYRNFGVLVTLSHFNAQVYDEVGQDRHPIALVCGRDVVDALRGNGLAMSQRSRPGWRCRSPLRLMLEPDSASTRARAAIHLDGVRSSA
jgi:hypothetical protein